MNYEDRTDLLPPERVLSASLLSKFHTLEEAVAWAWVFGLGVALVEADLSSVESGPPAC